MCVKSLITVDNDLCRSRVVRRPDARRPIGPEKKNSKNTQLKTMVMRINGRPGADARVSGGSAVQLDLCGERTEKKNTSKSVN